MGHAEHKLEKLLKHKCTVQPGHEQDGKRMIYRIVKLEDGCKHNKQLEERRLTVHKKVVSSKDCDWLREDLEVRGVLVIYELQPKRQNERKNGEGKASIRS